MDALPLVETRIQAVRARRDELAAEVFRLEGAILALEELKAALEEQGGDVR